MAIWKAKSEREFDPDNEVIFYCVEEPEAHLHPHQQRKLADYLVGELGGQSIITTHSPQISARFSPDSIVNLISNNGSTYAASDGCSNCISSAWDKMGYRVSIIPAEAFFSSCVLLVEGPSEALFYEELSRAIGVDLDYYNISILSVDGIQFEVYISILDALEIPWVMRTDNDVSKVPKKEASNAVGANRCMRVAGLEPFDHLPLDTSASDLVENGFWETVSERVNEKGIYLAKADLENDLSLEMPEELKEYSGKSEVAEAVGYLQKKKAIRMREFLSYVSECLRRVALGELAKPLVHAKKIVEGVK